MSKIYYTHYIFTFGNKKIKIRCQTLIFHLDKWRPFILRFAAEVFQTFTHYTGVKGKRVIKMWHAEVLSCSRWMVFAACLILREEGLLNFSSNLQASFSRISSLIKIFPFFLYCLLVLKEKDGCRREWEKRIYCWILTNPFRAIRIFKQGFACYSAWIWLLSSIFSNGRWMWVWKARKSISNLHFCGSFPKA